MTTFISGFFLGLSLIVAIGAQNAFVLKQGLQCRYVFLVCFCCAASDACLIFLGVTGFSTVIQSVPWLIDVIRYIGIAFLLCYAYMSFKSALSERHNLQAKGAEVKSWQMTLGLCLAFTWLNPHVYLDTLFLLGSIAAQHSGKELIFGLGAMTASFIFFFTLGYGARLLKPILEKPKSWQILEFCIGCMMLLIAIHLCFS